jgi:hypothetical protein
MDNLEGHMLFFGVFHRFLKKYRVIDKNRFGLILFIPENSRPYTKKFFPYIKFEKKSSGSSRHEKCMD